MGNFPTLYFIRLKFLPMKSLKLLLTCILLTGFACSCSTGKHTSLTYFEDLSESEGILCAPKFQLKIQPDDELMISVTSTVPEAAAPFNMPLVNLASGQEIGITTSPQMPTYLVNTAGDIEFPVLGKIHVAGMTIEQLTDYLTQHISQDVSNPVVLVRLRNFQVNVMGEVNSPGLKHVGGQRVTILDALAAAGDLTPYGERSSILVIREENGKISYHRINLNDSQLIESPYYYLQQNDVVLVEPNKIRQDNAKYNQFSSYKLSVISTVVSACSIIASLVIALTVK